MCGRPAAACVAQILCAAPSVSAGCDTMPHSELHGQHHIKSFWCLYETQCCAQCAHIPWPAMQCTMPRHRCGAGAPSTARPARRHAFQRQIRLLCFSCLQINPRLNRSAPRKKLAPNPHGPRLSVIAREKETHWERPQLRERAIAVATPPGGQWSSSCCRGMASPFRIPQPQSVELARQLVVGARVAR